MEKLKMAIDEYCKEDCSDCRFWDTCDTMKHRLYKKNKELCYDVFAGDLLPTADEERLLKAIFDAADTIKRMPTKNARRKWRGIQLGILIAYEILSGVDAYVKDNEIRESITDTVIYEHREDDNEA